jgi:hypothetical protein
MNQPKLGGTTDAEAFVPFGMNALLISKGEDMDEQMKQPEPQEANLQERPIKTLTDDSLPAAQIIHEQEDDAEQNHAPRFIP